MCVAPFVDKLCEVVVSAAIRGQKGKTNHVCNRKRLLGKIDTRLRSSHEAVEKWIGSLYSSLKIEIVSKGVCVEAQRLSGREFGEMLTARPVSKTQITHLVPSGTSSVRRTGMMLLL